MRKIVNAIFLLTIILSSCAREVVEPAQQISGRYALDDGTGLTTRFLEFNGSNLRIYYGRAPYPLAENQIWDDGESMFPCGNQIRYSIKEGILIGSDEPKAIAKDGDRLTLGNETYVRLDGFKKEPYSVIKTEQNLYEIPLLEGEYSFPVSVENPIPAGEVSADDSFPWISGVTINDGVVHYSVSTTKTPRSGWIVLQYTHAHNVEVIIKQSASTFIRLTETSKIIGYTSTTVEIPYTIENPVEGSELSVASSASWPGDIDVRSDKLVLNIPENNSGSDRTAVLTLSYDGAEDVTFTLTQEGKPVTSLSLNMSSISLHPGNTEILVVTVDPADASLLWSSNNISVATVDQNGKVTAVGNGNAIITVSAKDGSGKRATCSVTVTTLVTGITLNKMNLWLEVGQSETLIATILPSTASNKSATWSSSDSSVASVTSSGQVLAAKVGTALIMVTTEDGGKSANCSVKVVPSGAVDLGLSVFWASCNLCKTGFVSSPEDYGDYYAWGETETKLDYSWSTYKFGSNQNGPFSKYNTNSSYGTVDNKRVLETGPNGDDVASKKLGGSWRMPTSAEWNELRNKNNCTWTWATNYNGSGINGILVTASNGNSIFLPATGVWHGKSLYAVGEYGHYWSSSLYNSYSAWYVGFYSDEVRESSDYRYQGFSIRPVCEE